MVVPSASLPKRTRLDTAKVDTGFSEDKDQRLTPADKEHLEEVKQRPVNWKEYKPNEPGVGGGLVLAFLSLQKARKSVTAAMMSFLNLKFQDRMGPLTVRTLKEGKLSEVERVRIVDTEDSWNGDLQHGYLGMILKPVVDAGIKVEVSSIPLLRKREKLKSGEVINVTKDYDVEKMRDNFEAAVWDAAGMGPGTLIIIDSMSDYKDSITDEQEELFGKTIITDFKQKEDKSVDEENINLDRKFYRYRNKWWTNVLMKLRNSGAHVAETYKIEEREEEYRWKEVKIKVGKDSKNKWVYREETIRLDQYFPVWVKKSEYRIDNGYYIVPTMDDEGNFTYNFRTDWFKHRHSTMQFSKIPKDKREDFEIKCYLPYPDHKREVVIDLVEDMGKALLQEEIPDAELWGNGKGKDVKV